MLRNWNKHKVVAAAQGEMLQRMRKATILVRDNVKRKLNVGNPTGDDPSEEGESPRKVSARLFNSITEEVTVEGDQVTGRVGTNVAYARRLELGFHGTDSAGRVYDQGPRPYLRPGWMESMEMVRKILGAKR